MMGFIFQAIELYSDYSNSVLKCLGYPSLWSALEALVLVGLIAGLAVVAFLLADGAWALSTHLLGLRSYRWMSSRWMGVAVAVLAVVAWGSTSAYSSLVVDSVQVDQTETLRLMRKKQREQERAAARKRRLEQIRYGGGPAEISQEDIEASKKAVEGLGDDVLKGEDADEEDADAQEEDEIVENPDELLAGADEEEPDKSWMGEDEGMMYDFQRRGKREREEGANAGSAEGLATVDDDEDKPRADTGDLAQAATQDMEKPADQQGRMAPADDVRRLRRVDGGMRWVSYWLMVLGLIYFVLDYLIRFNNTQYNILPLPLAGRLVDAMSPKTRTLLMLDASDPQLRRYLQVAGRKNETWIYVGDRPLFDSPPPHTLIWDEQEDWLDARVVLENAWFGRQSFQVIGERRADALLDEMVDYLRRRRRTGASAWQTIHLVWDLEPLEGDELLRVLHLATRANFKLVFLVPPATEGFEDWVEEIQEPGKEPVIQTPDEIPLPTSWSRRPVPDTAPSGV